MLSAAFVLLGVAVVFLSYVCMSLARRLTRLESLLIAAYDAVGGSQHE